VVLGLFLLQTSGQGNSILGFLPLIVIFGIFYFLLFMPMQKQKKATARMLAELKAGDEVTTSGGIIGTVVSLSEDRVTLRIKPDNLKIQFSRSAVASLVNSGESK
jgi:preprotein translocase subunit YajC